MVTPRAFDTSLTLLSEIGLDEVTFIEPERPSVSFFLVMQF